MPDDSVKFSVRLPRELHKALRHKLLDDDMSMQKLIEAAIQAYIDGEWEPK